MRYMKFLAALSFAMAATAQAATYEVSFSAEGYQAGNMPVIKAPYAGKFRVEGAVDSPYAFGSGTMTSFELVLNGIRYTLDDVIVEPNLSYTWDVYGAENGKALKPRTNDFHLQIVGDPLVLGWGSGMIVAFPSSPSTRDYFSVGFQHTVTPVPEAGTVALAVAGLGMVGVSARRRRT